MKALSFSLRRVAGMITKEFIQLKRDRLTFAMLIGIPIIQLLLFGYAINTDPKDLPTAVVRADNSVFVRSYLKSLENTGYFRFVADVDTKEAADKMMLAGDVRFIVRVPADFTRRLVRGARPAILLEVDATDPVMVANAMTAALRVSDMALKHDLTGPLADLAPRASPVDIRIHRRFNPENITQYNIVPGLIGVILTLTLVIITSVSLARERERGTLENLYAMPVLPTEVMIGKITPFVLGAFLQVLFVLAMARLLFHIPFLGSIWTLMVAVFLFVTVNLAIGFTFSTLSKTQLQAIQMSIFLLLPSILLSGFVFPFEGMPGWAQFLGEGLPLTHFVRIVRAVMLKDAAFGDIVGHIWPLMVILAVVSAVALRRYRATLD